MKIMYRILIVGVLLAVVLLTFMDYFAFHGSIMLGSIADGQIVKVFDDFMGLFEGPQGNSNILYMTIFVACAMVGIVAILYKFIKG